MIQRRARQGFTLVEMLVSVAIISLMMVLFAEIFSLAGQSVGNQKGIARNDQRTRVLMNVIRADLDNRTFRSLVPFAPGETDPSPVVTTDERLRTFSNRRGFFYISENDPNSDADDVLQLTVEVDDSDPIFGAAVNLATTDDNEPDLDDGVRGNGASSSTLAVVSYFLRRGTLYRRVHLLRRPLNDAPLTPSVDVSTVPGLEFWSRFDNHAHFDGTDIVWHGVRTGNDWLDNTSTAPTAPTALGDPRLRFGHFIGTGAAREFGDDGSFIGRYTHQETSDPDFDWPLAHTNDPFDPTDATLTESDTDSDGVIDVFVDGTRRGEDILMQNCHAFDIKVFDSGADAFVDIGDATASDFATAAKLNLTYGPNGTFQNAFDTWHPSIDLDGDSNADEPPYHPSGTPNGAGALDDADLRPLRAIQITVRFYDDTSGQLRQATFQHALTFR